MGSVVLVIEDDPVMLQILHDVLELHGIRAIGVSNPEEVMAVARSVQPDLFLIDVMLKGKSSGIELAAELSGDMFSHTPMIAMTGSLYMAEIADETNLFTAIFTKPLELDALVTSISDQLAD